MLEDRNGGSGRRDENEEKEKVERRRRKKKKKEDTVNYFSSDISVVGGSVSWKRNRCYGSYPKRARRINGSSSSPFALNSRRETRGIRETPSSARGGTL